MGTIPFGPLVGAHVLVVDDNPDALTILSEVLGYLGALVSTAASAGAALNALRQVKADVVVCDINLGKRDAFWLIERVLRHQRPPFIAISAQDYDEAELKRAGFVAYFRKPVEMEPLTGSIVRAIGRD